MDRIEEADIVIGGGGLAGLTLALALAQPMKRDRSPASIIVVEPSSEAVAGISHGATALAAGARRMLEAIGLWPELRPFAQAVSEITITGPAPAGRDKRGRSDRGDEGEKGEKGESAALLTLSDSIEAGEPLAYVIENRALRTGLLSALDAARIKIRPLRLTSIHADRDATEVRLSDGSSIRTALVVGADGAGSRLRQRAGIATTDWNRDQSVIVTTLCHDQNHDGRAEEQFLRSGRAVLLPLTGRRSALLWSEERREAEYLVSLNAEDFEDELERRIVTTRGRLTLEDQHNQPRALPLSGFVARSFISDRLALVGDAAHVIHPIAGLGLNLGLNDVAALAEVIVDAARLGLDIGSSPVLERYQRWRRFDTVSTGLTTNTLDFLFSGDGRLGRAARSFGFGLIERSPSLKDLLVRHAGGLTGDAPRLLRGQPL